MTVLSSPEDSLQKGGVISIGNFDGVHRGHTMLLKHMSRVANERNSPSIIITFFPPAKTFFSGAKVLSTADEKTALLNIFNPNEIIMIGFDDAYANTTKDLFVKQLKQLEPEMIIVGENFRFGFEREGTLNDLSTVAKRLEVFNLKMLDDEVISSSRIRELLSLGHIAKANHLLGYSYSATGKVIEGQMRGRQIGLPTANITVSNQKALPLGVFAVYCETNFGRFKGMANVGPRPSFEDEPPSLEVHLFDFQNDLYNQEVKVEFEQFIRSQKKFDGLDELKMQLHADARDAKNLLD